MDHVQFARLMGAVPVVLQTLVLLAFQIINFSILHAYFAVSSNVLLATLRIIAFNVTVIIFWSIILVRLNLVLLLIAPVVL
jgi:hypothetical protein